MTEPTVSEDGAKEVFPGFFLAPFVEAVGIVEYRLPAGVARQLGMSVSGFHHHFNSVTAMTPLQFQKQIRLQEARRLILGVDLDAASAGFRVGYEDLSYASSRQLARDELPT